MPGASVRWTSCTQPRGTSASPPWSSRSSGGPQFGIVRVDDLESLPTIYTLVRSVTRPETHAIFRVGNDLLLEEYMDGVEFDVDLVMHDGRCVFSSVSQNWPTAEPCFQETGLHCPADHDKREVRRLVDLVIRTVQAFGLHSGVLHVEGKCTSRGPRIVEINARLGGGRVWQYVRDVWGVNLVDALVHACLGLPPAINASRRPQRAVVDADRARARQWPASRASVRRRGDARRRARGSGPGGGGG